MAVSNFTNARNAKEDEFYTQLVDIENELHHYKKEFKDKIVLCNCDDPYESNFFKYFALNFNYLGIKKLIATCYDQSPFAGTQLSLFNWQESENSIKKAYKIEISEVTDLNGDGAIDLTDVEYLLKNKKNTLAILEGNGDFRSQECIELLKQADIVVTNPPFSLFREYVYQLISYNKKFLIIGNQNAITYKEIFPLIKANKMWLGYKSGDMEFTVPQYYEPRDTRYRVGEDGTKYRSLGNICWYTNLDVKRRHETITLYKKYNPNDYPEYDNYFAINVNKVSDIPYDYYGAMGVPITFLDKYNPSQFEIVDANEIRKNNNVPVKKHGLIKDKESSIKGKAVYARIVIRKVEGE